MRKNVIDLFEQEALEKYPESIAVSDQGNSLTFMQLSIWAKIIALQVIDLNERINQPIGVFLPKSILAVVSQLAISYSSNFYVPIDIKAPRERLQRIIDNLNPAAIITNIELTNRLIEIGFQKDKIIIPKSQSDSLISESNIKKIKSRLARQIDTDPVYIIYTSGSTGIPKGVVISQRGVLDYIAWAKSIFPINNNDRIASQAPFYFDNSTLDIYLCYSTGACLCLIPEQEYSFPTRLINRLYEEHISFIFWVPSVLVSIANANALETKNLPFLKYILFAGEVMPAIHLNYWRKYYPNSIFANLYGPTEITVDCTYYIINRNIDNNESVPIGVACENTDVFILNEKNELAGVNENGELCVRGSSLALGYWNNPEQTEKAFIQNPLRREYPEKIYRTGDIAYINDLGEIIYVGRKDFQIKHLGYRIELGEIEAAIFSTGIIKNGCILYNNACKEIVLFYEDSKEIDVGLLRKTLLSKIPKYMLPSRSIRLDKIPLNANGKIDRIKLSTML